MAQLPYFAIAAWLVKARENWHERTDAFQAAGELSQLLNGGSPLPAFPRM
jgi:hypothetical protein